MAEEETVAVEDAPVRPRRAGSRKVARWLGGLALALLAIIAATVIFLHSSPGRQFIVDRIAKVAPASGLSVKVGRISGSVLWAATLYDVEFRDAQGTLFLKVPEVELNWRPYKFPTSGLDVRNLVLHDGTLYSTPDLKPGDPDAPILPDFDIRVDRFVVDNLTIAKGLLGDRRTVDFRAKADIRQGKVFLDADGALGGGDAFDLLVDAEPDGNKFDLDLDYRAPRGGLLATLAGAEEDLRARLAGNGTWTRWDGTFLALQGGERVGDFTVANRGGVYTVAGRARAGEYLTGLPARALGDNPVIVAVGKLQDSVAAGALALRGSGVRASVRGAVDLADNAFDGVRISASLRDPELLGEGFRLEGTNFTARLDGPFRDLTVPHELTVERANLSGTMLSQIQQRGTLRFNGTRTVIPLDARVARVESGNAMLDPRLVNGVLRGQLVLQGNRLQGDDVRLAFPGLAGTLALRGDLSTNAYEVSGPVRMSGLTLDNLGTLDGGARIALRVGGGRPWALDATFEGRMPRVTNETLANLAGTGIRFTGGVNLGGGRPIVLRNTRLSASKLSLTLDGRIEGGRTTIAGTGRHVDYGPFTVEAALAGEGPRAVLVFANPLPAAGLKDVRVALAPTANGFRIDTSGQSLLGPFEGLLNLTSPAGGQTRIAIETLKVWRTNVTGTLALGAGAASGNLQLAGGGLDGTILLAPRGGGQGFDLDLTARDASFAGATPLTIARADIDASGSFASGRSTIQGAVQAQGISYGSLFVGRLAGRAQVTNGTGSFNASLSGRRGSQFVLQVAGDVSPQRIAAAAKGSYGNRPIAMPRRAVLLKQPDGAWQLQPTQLNFGSGVAIAQGRFGGGEATTGKISLSKMPLSLIDAVGGDLGIGGTISGIIEGRSGAGGVPVGEARVMVDGLSRSGLLLTSRPIDLALVARLDPTLLQVRAVMQDDGGIKGRLQGRIANLASSGGLFRRLQDGDLRAQLRYSGPADALWRLAALDTLDLTGTLNVAADATGTLRNPQVRGTLAGDALRVQSVLTGTDIRQVRARGRFSGSRLQLTSFAGTAPNGGKVSGSGTIDLSDLGPGQGPALDIRMAADNAQIMDLATMGASVTGPMRLVSNGVGGTIAGRLRVNRARWRLGAAADATELPNIRTREINVPADIAPVRAASAPWRYLIDAEARDRVQVDGMGLESEWSADVVLRGTTADPRIGGVARIVPRRGSYSFAGTRFEITRGIIDFDENAPPDPRIDLVAETRANNLSVRVGVTGNATRPEISFTSTPSLPEEEVLARLLFGGSISNLSATDALQLGAALASLRGGSGMDPINKLRQAVGLDRLRIVPADPALDRGTALALGKRFGRRFYGEIITDGRGYNATEVEFRITSWLSLLATISSLGRESVSLRYSRDY
ncbi:translocation/assembly module TamB domain-containing protein [Tsuneonella sp. HG222]